MVMSEYASKKLYDIHAKLLECHLLAFSKHAYCFNIINSLI